jgi:glycosyltransferase involved in cell wall biosynthesis
MKQGKDIKISIIVPAFRQEKSIVEDLKSIEATMLKTRWDFEIICVVDGFIDKTFEKVEGIKSNNIKIYGYQQNKGKGYAIRYGMARSTGDYIAFIDSGMDINPNGLSLIMEHMLWYDADVIVASKRHLASKVHYPLIRKIYSFLYQILVRILFNLRIRDTQVGLKIYKRSVLEKVLPRLMVKKFAFDIELLSVANLLGFNKIYEAPVEIKFDPSNSNFNSFNFVFNKNIREMLLDTIAIFYRMNFLKYYNDNSKRVWVYDKELEMRVNTGELRNDESN